MTDQTQASGTANATTAKQPTANATMTEPQAAAPEPKVAAVETRALPQTAQTSTVDTDAVANALSRDELGP